MSDQLRKLAEVQVKLIDFLEASQEEMKDQFEKKSVGNGILEMKYGWMDTIFAPAPIWNIAG